MNTLITTELVDEARRDDWDAYLDGNDLAIAWQRHEWHEILQRHYPHDYFPLAAIRGGVICGVLPLYRLHGKANQPLISIPFAVAGGIVADSSEIEQVLLARAIALAEEQHAGSIVLKQYKHKIQGDLRTDDAYFNRELSISEDLDQAWDSLAPINRDMIGKARKAAFTLEYPCTSISEFYSLLLAYQHSQGIPCVSSRWIEDLVSSSMYTCALVRRNGKAIAGTLIKTFKKTVSFPFTALKGRSDLHNKAVYWLYWELIAHHAAKGYEIIHSGRVPTNEAVPQFRLGWGGAKYTYYYQYYPNCATTTESSRKRGLKRTLFTLGWRAIPLPVAARLGQSIVKKFP